MANVYFTHSSAPLKTVEEIQFGVLAPEEIKNMSVCHIIYPETMDETRMKPREGGLNDPLLGSIDRQFKCKTCAQTQAECPGHFGHIELAEPVFHPGFIKKVKKVLEMVCHNCSKVKVDRVSAAGFFLLIPRRANPFFRTTQSSLASFVFESRKRVSQRFGSFVRSGRYAIMSLTRSQTRWAPGGRRL
ncbi:hypothetical protein IMZ48_42130 [Candidatus Bathyarchaeota archaeon]|nr:hypothetical protein [Candidatus Bathyarchaeota archaeon]